MKASDLGEFGLIDRLARIVGQNPPSLLIGIGDDAAAWRTPEGSVLLATTDTLVAGVHFLPDLPAGRQAATPWPDLGWKALAVSVSDIAAMGGTPTFALVTLGIPPDLPLDAIDGLYAGLQECAQAYATVVAGGDIVRADKLILSVAVLGQAEVDDQGQPQLLRRDAAKAGHALAVTGSLGDAAAGLRLLRQGVTDHPLVRAHLRPQPPLAVGREAARLGVPAAIDISDGLLQDLGHICQRSAVPAGRQGLGAIVQAASLPLSDDLRRAFPDDAVALAASGGEDYQLLLAAPEAVLTNLAAASDVPLTVIGQMVEDPDHQVRLLDAAGADIAPSIAGWDHLRQA